MTSNAPSCGHRAHRAAGCTYRTYRTHRTYRTRIPPPPMLTVGTLDVRMRFHPIRTSGFFLTLGLGVGSLSFAGESESGAGAVVGVGWDIRMSRNVSLTPFYNGSAVSNSSGDANVAQVGIGITVH
jgi:hypothetical protein